STIVESAHTAIWYARRRLGVHHTEIAGCARATAATSSDLDLHPELDDAVRRDAKIRRRAPCVACDDREELLSPAHHAGAPAGEERLAAEIVRRARRRHDEAVRGAGGEERRDVGRFHEAILAAHLKEALAELLHRQACLALDVWRIDVEDREQHD